MPGNMVTQIIWITVKYAEEERRWDRNTPVILAGDSPDSVT